MEIELLYFDGCPSWEAGFENLKVALDQEGLAWRIVLTRIVNAEHAAQLGFLGSPSFRSGGVDFWPEARDTFELNCRVYSTPSGLKGVPTVDMLREKIHYLKNS